jgi:SH3-like domain-containing protein
MKIYPFTHSRSPFIVLFILLLILFFPLRSAFAQMMSVNGDKVNLRTGPGIKYKVKWEYGNGFPLLILKKKGKWVQVKDFEGDTGWIYRNLLTDKPMMIVKVNKNRKNKINIRNKPGTHGKIIGKAYYGVVFSTLRQKSGWVEVRHESGLQGWIKRNLLWGY